MEVNYNNGCIDTVCTVNSFNGEASSEKKKWVEGFFLAS